MEYARAKLFGLLRLAVAVAIVLWLANRVGFDEIGRHLASVDVPLLLAALGLMFADSLVKAWNWQKLISSLVTDREVSFMRVMSWYFAGGFLGAVVPSWNTTRRISHTT